MAISAARIFLEAEKRKNDQLRADLRKLVAEGKKKHAIESGATWFIKEIEKLLNGGE